MASKAKNVYMDMADLLPNSGRLPEREHFAFQEAVRKTKSDTFADQLIKFPETWFDERKMASHLPGARSYVRTQVRGAAALANSIAKAKERWIVSGDLGQHVCAFALGDQSLIEKNFSELKLPAGSLWVEFDRSACASIEVVVKEFTESDTVVPNSMGFMIDAEEGGRKFTLNFVSGGVDRNIESSPITIHVDLDDPTRMDQSVQFGKWAGLPIGTSRETQGLTKKVKTYAEFSSLSIGTYSGFESSELQAAQNAIMDDIECKNAGKDFPYDLPYPAEDIIVSMYRGRQGMLELFSLLALINSGKVNREEIETDLTGNGPKSLGKRYDILRSNSPKTFKLTVVDGDTH